MTNQNIDFKRFEIYMTQRCNRNCVYCFAKDNLKTKLEEIDFNTISKSVYKAKKNGFNYITLLGGEPTVHKDFFKVLALVKKLGFKIHIFTNGLKFSDYKFALKVKKIGADFLALNLPDYRKEEFEFLTGLKGSYSQIIKALKNIQKLKIPLSSIFLVTKINYSKIENYVEYYYKMGLKLIVIQYLNYLGNADKNTGKIKVKISNTLKYMKKASDNLLKKGGYPFFYEHLPACFLKEYENKVLDLYLSGFDESECIHPGTPEEKSLEISYKHRIKTPQCKKCIYLKYCPGIEKKYLEIYGSDEIKPVTKKAKQFWENYKNKEYIRKSKLSFLETMKEFEK